MELMTWENVKEELKSYTSNNLLLGNGFSRDYCNRSFNQQEILS